MSYTNYLDADAAWRVVSDFPEPAVAIIKHTNPCGLAVHPDQPTAYRLAFEGDSVSAYGGIVGFNRTVTADTARAMRGVLFDIIVAPDYDEEALNDTSAAHPHPHPQGRAQRAAQCPASTSDPSPAARSSRPPMTSPKIRADWQVVTERAPTGDQLRDLAFAWRACKHIKSNTIVLAKDNHLIGMGAGQPNRVTSVHLALRIAEDKAKGSVLASDAFFPFPDSIEMAAQGGVVAIAQPGGSIRDEDSIQVANRLGLAMVLTGTRHFRH